MPGITALTSSLSARGRERLAITLDVLVLFGHLFLAETLWATLANPHFLGHGPVGVAVAGLVYLAAGLALGGLCAFTVPAAHARAVAFTAAYGIVAAKLFVIDAQVLSRPPILGAFVLASLGLVVGLHVIRRRFGRSELVYAIVLLCCFGMWRTIGDGWRTHGGELGAFVRSPRTLGLAAAWSVGGLLAAVAALRLPARLRWRADGVLALAALAAIVGLSQFAPATRPAPANAEAAQRPDIFVLSVDALRADSLAAVCAGKSEVALPALQRICSGRRSLKVVAAGVSTEDVLAANTLGPSGDCRDGFPEALRALGYRSYFYLGRYGKRFDGIDCYDHSYSGLGTNMSPTYAIPSVWRALAWRSDARHLRWKYVPTPNLIAALRRDLRDASAPVLAYLHTLELHAPVIPRRRVDDGAFVAVIKRYMTTCYAKACDLGVAANVELAAAARRAYDEALVDVDADLAELLALIEARGRPALVVITSDHGELFGEHGGFAHGGGFVPELIHVPFVVLGLNGAAVRAGHDDCRLMTSADSLRDLVAKIAGDGARASDRSSVTIEASSLGHAVVSADGAPIRYELTEEAGQHRGTWRNIHADASGTVANSWPLACAVAPAPLATPAL